MATATADATSPAAPAGKGKKKLMIIVVALLVLLGLGAGGAFLVMQRNLAAVDADDDVAAAVPAAPVPDKKNPPTYLALDPFVVNLADKDSERYAQIAVTLEVDDAKFAEQMKAYMPSIRNSILLVLAHKSSQELLQREGKVALAAEIMREAVRPLGIDIAASDDEAPAVDDRKSKKRKPRAVHNPVTHVHFANFIIQ